MLNYYLSIFIFLSFIFIYLKVFFEKNNKVLSNILKLTKFTLISGFVSISIYKLINFINSDSDIFLFYEFKSSFLIFIISTLYITIVLSKFNKELLNENFKNKKKSYFGSIYYFIVISTITFINLDKSNLYSSIFLSIGIAVSLLIIYDYIFSTYKPKYIFISLILTVPLITFLFFNNYIEQSFYFLIPMAIFITCLKLYENFIFNIKVKYFEKIIKNTMKNINYIDINKTNLKFLNKFNISDITIDLNNIVLSYENIKEAIKFFIIIKNETFFLEMIEKNKLNIFLLKTSLNGELNISYKDLNFFYCKKNIDNIERMSEIKIDLEPEDLESTIIKTLNINEILNY